MLSGNKCNMSYLSLLRAILNNMLTNKTNEKKNMNKKRQSAKKIDLKCSYAPYK